MSVSAPVCSKLNRTNTQPPPHLPHPAWHSARLTMAGVFSVLSFDGWYLYVASAAGRFLPLNSSAFFFFFSKFVPALSYLFCLFASSTSRAKRQMFCILGAGLKSPSRGTYVLELFLALFFCSKVIHRSAHVCFLCLLKTG